jgi:dipeptidyl aminopeptidase/acylaminoacyl peptidase
MAEHVVPRTSERSGASTDSLMGTLMQNGYVMLWGYPLGLPLIQDFFQQQPLDELAKYKGPALLVHATGDPTVPVSQCDVYAEHFGERALLHKLEEESHTFEHPPAERQAIELTLDWFSRLFEK